MREKHSEYIGKKFGQLTVIEVVRDKHSQLKANCHCECGKDSKVFLSNLKSGRTKSCGHLEAANRKRYTDLTNQKFGSLVVVRPTSLRQNGTVVWSCHCDCGREVLATKRQLVKGHKKSCNKHKYEKLVGQRFASLEVLTVDLKTKQARCRCDCGKEIQTRIYNVLDGHTKSCGHLKKQSHLTSVNGTTLESLKTKVSKSNTSGYKGVSQTRNGKWVAYITLRRKRYHLGIFDSIDEAVEARKAAEEEMYQPILKHSLSN